MKQQQFRFRAFYPRTGELMEANNIIVGGQNDDWTTDMSDIFGMKSKDVVYQLYSDRRDRNGTLICQGDIVYADNTAFNDIKRYKPYEVKFHPSDGFYLQEGGRTYKLSDYEWCHIYIAGNIAKNPELLSKKHIHDR